QQVFIAADEGQVRASRLCALRKCEPPFPRTTVRSLPQNYERHKRQLVCLVTKSASSFSAFSSKCCLGLVGILVDIARKGCSTQSLLRLLPCAFSSFEF